MKFIKYAVLCEDTAQREFLQMVLPLLTKENMNFEFVKTRIEATTKTQVDKRAAEACKVAFINHNVELFLVCRDVDSDTQKEFNRLYEMFNGMFHKLQEKHRNQCVIVLPVRCIEHWFWYIKYHQENPNLTKNITLENKTGNEAKTAVYDKVKVSKDMQEIRREIMESIDVEKLISRSESFKKFHGDFTNVMKLLP